MLYDCNTEITIKKVDNGYILAWEKKREEVRNRVRDRGLDDFEHYSGVELFTSRKELMKRVDNLL